MIAHSRPEPTYRQRLIEWACVGVCFGFLGLLLVGPPWKRYLPPPETRTIEDLIAQLPETYCFASVEHEGTSYVVWVGRPRGPIVSGPPVCVFDTKGRLVDWSSDTGDSNNGFVRELHSLAYRSKPISVDEAIAICRP